MPDLETKFQAEVVIREVGLIMLEILKVTRLEVLKALSNPPLVIICFPFDKQLKLDPKVTAVHDKVPTLNSVGMLTVIDEPTGWVLEGV